MMRTHPSGHVRRLKRHRQAVPVPVKVQGGFSDGRGASPFTDEFVYFGFWEEKPLSVVLCITISRGDGDRKARKSGTQCAARVRGCEEMLPKGGASPFLRGFFLAWLVVVCTPHAKSRSNGTCFVGYLGVSFVVWKLELVTRPVRLSLVFSRAAPFAVSFVDDLRRLLPYTVTGLGSSQSAARGLVPEMRGPPIPSDCFSSRSSLSSLARTV